MLTASPLLYQESGVEIMKISAAELRDMEATNVAQFEQHMLATLHRPYIFKLKIAEETYQDETRIKVNIMR